MKRKIMALFLAGMLAGVSVMPVFATESENTAQTADSEASDGEVSVGEVSVGEAADGEASAEEMTDKDIAAGEAAGIVIPKGNMVDVEMIDLSLHTETTGEFTPVYAYENPFKGQDTSKGAIIEFYAKPTWDVHVLGTIFAINGSGEYDGKLYFTPGSYLGYNSADFGGFFDANMYDYNIVRDYIKDGALIRIEFLPTGFAVYANGSLCYDQSILKNPEAGAGDFTPLSDFGVVLEWLSGAEALYFGYGSWWNTVSDVANIELSHVNIRLADGTILMNQLQADKDLVESLGGSITAAAADTQKEVQRADVHVEIFDINSVEYQGSSVLPLMTAVVAVVTAGALAAVILACKQRTYE